MRIPEFVRRYRWSILIVLIALAAWYPAFNYLVDFRTPDVPFVTTPHDVVAAMLDLAEVGEGDVVYDLGSGDGRILLAAAERGAKAVGIELDPPLVEQSREAVRAAGRSDRVTVHRGDIFKYSLKPATVITMFLKSDVNERLRPQLDAVRPGTRVVSHAFRIPGAKVGKKIEVKSADDGLGHPVYLYVTPIEWE